MIVHWLKTAPENDVEAGLDVLAVTVELCAVFLIHVMRFHGFSIAATIADWERNLLLLLLRDSGITVNGLEIPVAWQLANVKRIDIFVPQVGDNCAAGWMIGVLSRQIHCFGHNFHEVPEGMCSKWLSFKPYRTWGILLHRHVERTVCCHNLPRSSRLVAFSPGMSLFLWRRYEDQNISLGQTLFHRFSSWNLSRCGRGHIRFSSRLNSKSLKKLSGARLLLATASPFHTCLMQSLAWTAPFPCQLYLLPFRLKSLSWLSKLLVRSEDAVWLVKFP